MLVKVKRVVGWALFFYGILYAMQVLFNRLYADAFSPQHVYDVMNYCTAVGIAISIAVVSAHKRRVGSSDDSPAGRFLAAQAGFYMTMALALLYFPLWFSLLFGDTVTETSKTWAGYWCPRSIRLSWVRPGPSYGSRCAVNNRPGRI